MLAQKGFTLRTLRTLRLWGTSLAQMSIMSTISFPNPHSPSHIESPSSSVSQSHLNAGGGGGGGGGSHINFFPTSFDPQASMSSFQINPLSSHPPRTPRTSLLNAAPGHDFMMAPLYGAGGVLDIEEKPYEDDVDSEKLEMQAGKRVRKEEVWREMLATSTGRDKALVRLFLFFYSTFYFLF